MYIRSANLLKQYTATAINSATAATATIIPIIAPTEKDYL